jgi:putative ABC transport system permease protein
MVGVVVFTAGCFATAAAVGAASQDRSMFVILSVALTLAGVVMCTPYLIGKLERVGSRARGSQRLALRSLARQRSRSGPMAAAIMAAGCLALGGATYALAVDHNQRVQAAADPVYRGSITVSMERRDVSTGKARDVSCEDTLALLRREVAPLMHSPQTTCFPFHTAMGTGSAATFTVVDPSALAPFDLQEIARHLSNGKIVAMIGSDAEITSVSDFSWLTTYRSRLVTIEPSEFVQTVGVGSPVWISPQTARTLGLRIGIAQTVGFVTQPTPFSGHQSASIDRLVSGDLGAALSTATDDVWVNVSSIGSAPSDDYSRIVYAIILPIGIVLSLLTVAVGLFLLNAESRDERTALVALGAGPSERRRQNAWQAGGLAFVAMLLAVPPGLALPYVVMRAADNELTYGVPWVVLAVLVIGVPLMAAVGAFIFTRPRVPSVPRRV